MHSLLRRTSIIGTTQRRVLARANPLPDSNELKKKFAELDIITDEKYLYELRSKLVKWNAIKDYTECIKESENMDLLRSLDIMSGLYEKPLKLFQRTYVRNQLLNLFNAADNQDEKKLIFSLINYYDLLDEDSP